jgi:hypothetical protein
MILFCSGQSFDCRSLKTIVKGGRKLLALISLVWGKFLHQESDNEFSSLQLMLNFIL